MVVAAVQLVRDRHLPAAAMSHCSSKPATLDLYNNRIGYILLHVEPGLPLGVILLTAFISGIPKELDEAAWIDGFSQLSGT